MGFLSGRVSFERFRVISGAPRQFGQDHIETLEKYSIDRMKIESPDQPRIGFLAGEHLLDLRFGLEKNIINDALHFGIRIDSDQIPAAIKRAWLQMELAALTADNPSGRPTKVQRQEAKEAVEARCEEEARSGKFRRMQQFPVLWDVRNSVLYFGGSSASAMEQSQDLLEQAFEVELERITSGKLAQAWATEAKQRKALEAAAPCGFLSQDDSPGEVLWWNGHSENYDYLGNEFLLWLWWHWDTESDTLTLPDGSEATGMFARTLSLECPRGESGKETISAESPVDLPEAWQAIQSGKLPRKAGLTLVRYGEQYELALQAESFAVGGAKLPPSEADEERSELEDRIDRVRNLSETLDLLYQTFCQRRLGKSWTSDLQQMRSWLKAKPGSAKKPAA